jgi:signal transduction histidine kinase
MKPRSLLLSLLRCVLVAPLWAVPFALFFGTLFGATWPAYRLAYGEALVITLAVRLALWLTEHAVLPVLKLHERFEEPWLPITAVHVAMAVLASFAGAFAIQWTVDPHFIPGPRALIAVALWSLLFSALFAAFILARRFYAEKLQRAAQVERIRAELIRAELRALQAQVNPHFLFNTLNSIAALIAENPAAAEDLTTQLADVFRYVLTASRREHVRLDEELDFVRTCLAIERVRFGDRLRIVERIEPGLGGTPVPALLLQPLVENAVRYSVAPREQGGELRIEATRSGGALRLVVADDGPGFSPDAPPRGTGVGLENVRERLRLAGAGHTFELDTAPGRGTRITLVVPLVTGEPATAAAALGARA